MNSLRTGDLLKDIRKLEKKYSLHYREILRIVEKNYPLDIPLSIFTKSLGSFESITKYLRENLNLSFREISVLTDRKVQPVRTTYLRAKAKHSDKLNDSSEKRIPLSLLKNRKLSVLENLVSFLLDSGYSIEQISALLKRDYKTVWTISKRAQKKS